MSYGFVGDLQGGDGVVVVGLDGDGFDEELSVGGFVADDGLPVLVTLGPPPFHGPGSHYYH